MTHPIKIKNALISTYSKNNLENLVRQLNLFGVKLYSTGGTENFIRNLGIDTIAIEDLSGYPSILGGRVKTLHPKIFGGILARRDDQEDQIQVAHYDIPKFDLVIVDLYPFEETVKTGSSEEECIEKIDIGGISLIRAAAKNYQDVTVIASESDYQTLAFILKENEGTTNLTDRKKFAQKAFNISYRYDMVIFNYFNQDEASPILNLIDQDSVELRYGENPHQKAYFYGKLEEVFDQLMGKELSYNNLVDIDAAIDLIDEFKEPTFAIIKHTNACGVASRDHLLDAWKAALACDPISAFGGVLISNKAIDKELALEIDSLFFEILIAPSFSQEALEVLSNKKKRIILKRKNTDLPTQQFKSLLNGLIRQDKDLKQETAELMTIVTTCKPTKNELDDLLFANKIVKHTKSNAIVLAKNATLLASGVGQTSRIDALNQAIAKTKTFNFDLKGSVMASDAFFPFPDCVELAGDAGISTIVQPGGSIKDQESIHMANQKGIGMALTGLRHFKH